MTGRGPLLLAALGGAGAGAGAVEEPQAAGAAWRMVAKNLEALSVAVVGVAGRASPHGVWGAGAGAGAGGVGDGGAVAFLLATMARTRKRPICGLPKKEMPKEGGCN